MTVIAYDGRYVAADRQATCSGNRWTTPSKLVVWKENVLVIDGHAGHGSALIAWFKEGASPPDYPTPRTRDPDANAGLTVFGWGRPVVRFEDGPYPILMEGSCYAVGSGSLFAHGAMRAGASAATAASLAAQYVEYCGGEIDVVDLKELTDDAAR